MTQTIIGHNAQVSEFLGRFRSGRFPHAWIFEGPKGVGKAEIADMLASVVFGETHRLTEKTFTVSDGSVRQKQLAGSYPDYRYIARKADDSGKLPQNISVADIRNMNSFFELQASEGGYRVAIIDAMDELNANGANAILKTLEEPPEKSVLILIYHRMTPMLPTIRSRCVSLKFSALGAEDLQKCEISDNPDETVPESLINIAEGSPGRLRTFLQANANDLVSSLDDVLNARWPDASGARFSSLLGLISDTEIHVEIASGVVSSWLKHKAETTEIPSDASRFAAAWNELQNIVARGLELKLDRSETAGAMLNMLIALQKSVKGRQLAV